MSVRKFLVNILDYIYERVHAERIDATLELRRKAADVVYQYDLYVDREMPRPLEALDIFTSIRTLDREFLNLLRAEANDRRKNS